MNQSKNKMMKKMLPVLVGSSMVISMLGTAAAAAPSDVSGHWAAKQLNEWQGKSWIQGYEDGKVKPNNTVTRAEFMAFVNRAFGLTAAADVTFKDVNKSGWEYAEISKAVKAGYISGYEDGTIRSGNEISRQEAASIIAKLLNLTASDAEKALGKFADSQKIAVWSKHAIAALSEKAIINGYDDGSYRPSASITRAEAVVTIDRALAAKATVYDKAGTFGPESGTQTIEGDVVISAPGVTLRNVTITGNLLFAEGIGSGDAFLDGVTVKGSTTVKGGGENSVHFKNTVLVTVIVNKKDGSVRIVAEGSTTVQHVTVQSSTKIEESSVTGSGFNNVDLSAELPKDSKVTMVGDFEDVEVFAKSIVVEVSSGSINKFGVGKDAGDSSINLSKDAKIVTLVLDAIAKVLGDGKVEKATVNDGAKGSSFDKKPDKVDGPQKDSTLVNNPSTGGGGSSSGGSSNSGSTLQASKAPAAELIFTANYFSGSDIVFIYNTYTNNNDGTVSDAVYTVPAGATVKVYDAGGNLLGSRTVTALPVDPRSSTVVFIPDGGFGSTVNKIYVTITESGKSESTRVEQAVLHVNVPKPEVSDVNNHLTGSDDVYLKNVPMGNYANFYDEEFRIIPAMSMTPEHYQILNGFNPNQKYFYIAYRQVLGRAGVESDLTRVDIPAKTTLSSIAITTPATKLVYTVGDMLDITGLAVTGTYSDGSTKAETVALANVTGFDSTAPAASQTLTVTVGGRTTTYTVEIKAPVTLSSIAITTPATKLVYTVGDTLDITGLAVTGTYSDGSTKAETVALANVTGFDSTAPAASQTLTVTVGGRTTTYTVEIKAPVTLSSIAITTPATKLVYTVGDTLDITGLAVTGTYSDSSTKAETVALANVTGFDSTAPAASQTLTVTVGGRTTTYTVEIKAPVTLSSIAITTPATKLVYTVGDTLDITGLEVTGTYSDSSTKAETVALANVTGFDSTAPAASQTLTVTVGGRTTTYTVEIKAPVTLSSIAITTPASKLVYTVGDMLDITGLAVTGTYSDSSTKAETVALANVTGFDSTAPAASQTLTVTVGGRTTTYTVEIKAPVTLSSIAITTPATKLVYTVGDTLDITGLAVTGTYSDSSTKAETVALANVTGFDSTAPAASQTLTVTVGGRTTTYTVEIKAPVTLSSIAITTPATKLVYTVGDTLDITGLEVTGTYSDGSTKAETVALANVTGFDSTAPAASQTLTVTVGGQTTTYTVEIKAPVTLSSIAITTPATKLVYTVGDTLDITGLAVTGTYSDGSTKAETVALANVTGFDSTAPAASQTLTVTVGGRTTTYTVEIKAPVILSSIAITTPATKLVYTVGDTLDITGLAVTGTYSDGSTKAETVALANVTGFDSTAPAASQTLTVTVGGRTTTYTVEIKAPVTLSSIAITTPATKLVYTVGDTLDITGLAVTGTYSDSSTKAETVALANVTGFDSTAPAASQTLTVTVGGRTTTYTVEIKAPVTLSSIAITTPATKLVYTVGDMLDITGLAVTGTYSDGSTKAETVALANVTGFDSTAPAASQTLTVTVGGRTTTYTVEIKAPVTLSSIAITIPATKLVYTVGDTLDITGLAVTGTYSDGSTKAETVALANVTGFDSTAPAASQTLTVTVGGRTTTYTVEIKAPVTLSSIAITTPASKLVYTVGDMLDITGLAVTGTYSDGSTKAETVALANVTGFDSTAPAASQTLTVTVGGQVTTYTVEIQ